MKPTKRLLWQLFPSYLLIVLLLLFAINWYASHTLRPIYLEHKALDLEVRALLAGRELSEALHLENQEMALRLCKTLGWETEARVTAILPTGKVLGDSQEGTLEDDPGEKALEVKEALKGQPATHVRFSRTGGMETLFVAVPIKESGEVIGIVRLSVPLSSIDKTLEEILWEIGAGGLIIAFFAAVISLIISRRLSRPLEDLKKGAQLFARGELKQKLVVPPVEEIEALAEAMNQMAAQLSNRIDALTDQRNELEAVLSSLAEGVIAVDGKEKILRLNEEASRMLRVEAKSVQGKPIQEAVRNRSLHMLVEKTLKTGVAVEKEILLYHGEERFLQAKGTVLKNGKGESIGALLVLNDITRLRRLEDMRRDFVANVSHELKTPVTSIKGFVETLLDGASNNPEESERFLAIVLRQADRLNAIISDLLSLARIEKEGGEIELEKTAVIDIIERALQTVGSPVSDKVKVTVICEEGLRAMVNPPLLEQALVNLISNAANYSEKGGTIEIRAAQRGERTLFEVQDWGCGISQEHHSRLFERFYRVDKARSRKLGGTGLGLAIVKHIAQSHGGWVSVRSEPGKGSTFTIHLKG